MTLSKFMKEELCRYENLQDRLEKQLQGLPKGAIIRRREGNYSLKVRVEGKQYLISLNPSDMELFNQLKLRRYISKELPLLNEQLRLCRDYVRRSKIIDPCKIEASLKEQYHGMNDMDIFMEGDFDPEIWKEQDYVQNPFKPEKKIHVTEGGIKTRSKSEAMIGTQLERSGFAYRYEEELQLGGRSVYPDFTVLRQAIRRIVYWEHLGMVDNPEYMMKNLKKIDEYAANGIFLGYNLIVTYETKTQPLTISSINEKIKLLADDTSSFDYKGW